MLLKRHGSLKPPRSFVLEISSILLLALGAFSFLSLVSFDSSDPSFLTNSTDTARNLCGFVGSFLSAALFYGLGIGAFVVPAGAVFVGVTLRQKEGWVKICSTLTGLGIAVLSVSVFLSIQKQTWEFGGTALLTGGALGAWFSNVLIKPFNVVGASILSLVAFLIAVVSSTPISISQFLARGLQWSSRFLWRASKLMVSYGAYVVAVFFVWLVQLTNRFGQVALERISKRKTGPVTSAIPALSPIRSEPNIPEDPIFISDLLKIGTDAPSGSEAKVGSEISSPNRLEVPQVSEVRSVPRAPRTAPRSAPAGPWKLPTTEFLRKPLKIDSSVDRDQLYENSRILKDKFADFGINGEVTAVRPGPVITLYEFRPGPGIKVSRIATLADDLSMALSAESVRILAPLPGRSVVGIEIPSEKREKVFLREFLQDTEFHTDRYQIPVVMGKDIGGEPVLSDLARMPHLLCAGQTGSGKSVFMNNLICSLFYRFTPDELRMILVDPKFIEFRAYQDIPHLLLPVVDDAKHAAIALKWAVREMERRYRILAMMGARNLAGYNQKVDEMGADVVHDLLFSEENQAAVQGLAAGADWIEAFEPDEGGAPRVGKLPYIVVIIDELADLMMVAKKEVELSIARISQKARAAGIHLVIATQRPSTDVITGLIKANLPARASFKLASHIDSKTILDRAGAERLLGQGDMLFIPPGTSQLLRLHGAYVDDDEIQKITSFLRSQGKPVYRDEILYEEDSEDQEEMDPDSDELFERAVDLVRAKGDASASFLQRHLKVGYNRAARLIETMESRGIVGPADGARPREVLMR